MGCDGSERFTRRTATVTISAPDASIARAVSSKSLYLPVPTRRRERKRLPATSKASSPAVWVDCGWMEFMRLVLDCSTAADEVHDLKAVAVHDLGRVEGG